MNLCVSARDAMPDGGTLTLALHNVELDEDAVRQHGDVDPGQYLCLSVSDTGTGIPSEVPERMFEPFFTTKDPGKGTGLGLSIVHGIVKSHNGHIEVDTAPGQGTEFRVFLPAVEDEPEDENVDAEEAPRGQGTLMLVEDDANVREIGHKMLVSLGYQVFAASDGNEALGIYRSKWREVDLVITDLVIPGLGEVDLCQEMVRINADVKVLLMSGYEQRTGSQTVLKNGSVMGFLRKPFDLGLLASEVRTALEKTAVAG